MPAPEAPTATADAPTLDAPESTEKAPTDFMSDIIGELADIDSGKAAPQKPAPKEKPAKAPPEPPAKPAAAKKPVEEPKAPEKEDKPPEDDVKQPVKPVKAAELRNAYEGLKKRVKEELEPEIQRLRARTKESEEKQPEQVASLNERIKQLEGKNKELQQQLSVMDYTTDPEYIKQYEEPYVQAWKEAIDEFKELTVREKAGEDDDGEPVFRKRPATEQDLLRLSGLTLSDMDEEAQNMFGPSAPRAVNHIQHLRKLYNAREKARSEAPNRAGEWKTKRERETQEAIETRAKAWDEATKALKEKWPRAFVPDDGDDVDKEAFTRGSAFADLMFYGPKGLSEEQIEALPVGLRDTVKGGVELSPQQTAQVHALGRLKMTNHDRALLKLKAAHTRIKELEKIVSEYEGSEPEAGAGGDAGSKTTTPKDWLQTVDDELRAMDK